ncbi:hypothetical protein MATR_17060 [Marivirga tractuosa]|uniref:Uncharacterized protein n=1 Tax=Marivirga tractuosa (strain ATCC 23168 / DSM 4126 / NBRC 15989 / NCIMB 1408 / VKM B-1430 / H-43) TaxID=643867 RepID=E4TRD5_MARTH|nr:hypothetical protein [Marivirga tractuosa]ADR20669.1 hypothetical protein Ftrac_0667 [Marivirga tractuosa DSM 4126]BDD14881.1 hypothetical protein MATR_17060 [Marivirga tractuosa]
MRTLTGKQKEQLANHIAKKPIEYIELYNELYDHYASAYETGENDFEATLEALDQEFDYYKLVSINRNLVGKTMKMANTIYLTEFKKFWRWPQIISTLAIIFLGYTIIEFLPMDFIFWGILIPLSVLTIGIPAYGYILSRFKKYGNKRLNSAHLSATTHFIILPTSLFNLSASLPAFFLEPYQSREEFYVQHPVVPLFMILLFLSLAFIGLKVFRTKIKVQYL